MRTLDDQGPRSYSFASRLARDARVLRRLVRMLFGYLVLGGRVRRRYRAKERAGEVYWLDEPRP